MLGIPPVKQWKSYAQLGIMKLQGKEVICHGIGERCRNTSIRVRDILEAQTRLISQKSSQRNISSQVYEQIQFPVTLKQLSARDAAQLVWHSFRFSNGNASLQFTMLQQAWKKYGNQEITVEEVFDELKKLLKVGKTNTSTRTYDNPSRGRPPHPDTFTVTTEHNTDIGLSSTASHKTITSYYISESTEVVKMLLKGEGGLRRSSRDGDYYISASRGYLNASGILQAIFEADFKYLLNTNYKGNFEGRPNRNPENDGRNNLQDRFFSYLVWFGVKKNNTGSDFFDEYFSQIQDLFLDWFQGLPNDSELEKLNIQEKREKEWYHDKKPFRKDKYGYFTQLTKEDILLLIMQYNATHPKTQVEMSELGL